VVIELNLEKLFMFIHCLNFTK